MITGELAGPTAGIQPDDQTGEDLGGPIATAFGYQRPYLRKGEDYPQSSLSRLLSNGGLGANDKLCLAGRLARETFRIQSE